MGREKEREKERERERVHARGRESPRESALAPPFICFFLPWACPMQIGLSQECCLFCLFCLKSSLWSLDLPCLLATAILDSFSLFYLPNIPPLKRWEAQFFGNRSIEVFLATSCRTGMARGIGPPSLASLKPQSPYSSVHITVCDIFHVRL